MFRIAIRLQLRVVGGPAAQQVPTLLGVEVPYYQTRLFDTSGLIRIGILSEATKEWMQDINTICQIGKVLIEKVGYEAVFL